MIKIGLKGSATRTVDESLTAKTMGSGTLDVFATPAMIALIEEAACACLSGHLEDGITTVGTLIHVQHTAATPIGCTVRAECEITEIDGRRYVFRVSAFDECGPIGDGIHERFAVDSAKFMQKTNKKSKQTN